MPTLRSTFRAHRLGYVVLAALFVISFTDWARNSSDRIDELRYDYARPPFDLGDFAEAFNLQPEADAAGVRAGDVVARVHGRPLEGITDFHAALRYARAGDRLLLQLRTGNTPDAATRDVSIDLRTSDDLGMSRLTAGVLAVLFLIAMPLFCIVLGFWVAAVRIDDRAAWALLVLALGIAAIIGSAARTMFGNPDAIQPLLTGYRVFFNNLPTAGLMLFAIAFPERLPLDRRHPWVKWVLLAPLVLHNTAQTVVLSLMMHHLALVHRYWDLYLTVYNIDPSKLLQIGALLVFFAIMGWRTVTTSNRDARRRLLLLAAAGIVSFIPPAVLVALVILRGLRMEGWAPAAFLTMLIFPVTMAYVIVVHRAMDVRVVIRQGLQYALARGGIRAIQITLMVVVSLAATSLLTGNAGTLRVGLVIAGMVLIVGLGGRFADRLRQWVDRRFFREAYEADVILSDLATRVRTQVETRPLLELVATKIAESLHVRRVAILLENGGSFHPAYALGYETAPDARISGQGLTVRRLGKQPQALVRFDDAESWVHLADDEERESLVELQSELLMPLSFNDKLVGIMSLGPKQSEEPFSRTDIRLLDSVAAQTGLALENGRLTAAIAAEEVERARERRDLEIAREVQERLFPQEYPPIARLDYAGACRPALGVGGDYYDFILLPNAHLGIAIGDVSGKGIPAALLMASLRAYLRGAQTIHHQSDLTEVMRNLNKLVYESSAANRYATFFYGEFDSSSRVLRYVNAGHNPPMLFRHGGSASRNPPYSTPDSTPNTTGNTDVVRLDTGGPVIGLLEACDYAQGCVTLEPGDLLVAYTDGISEAMNAAHEDWGEEALIRAVRSNGAVSASALITQVIDAADAFAAGAPQHDDMTAIVVRAV